MTDFNKDLDFTHAVPSAPPPFEYGLPEQKISLTALHTTSPGTHTGGTLPRNPVHHSYHHLHHPSQQFNTISRTMYTPYALPSQSEYIPGQMSTEFPDGNVTIGFPAPPPGFLPPPSYPVAQQSAGPSVGSQFSAPVSVGYSRIQASQGSHPAHHHHHPHHQYQPSFSRTQNPQFPAAHHLSNSPPAVIDGGQNNSEVYNATTVSSSSSQSVSNAYKRRRGLIAVSCFTGLILLIILIVFSL